MSSLPADDEKWTKSGLSPIDGHRLWKEAIGQTRMGQSHLLIATYSEYDNKSARNSWEPFFQFADIKATVTRATYSCAYKPYTLSDLKFSVMDPGILYSVSSQINDSLTKSMLTLGNAVYGHHLPAMMVLKEFALWNRDVLAKMNMPVDTGKLNLIQQRISLIRAIGSPLRGHGEMSGFDLLIKTLGSMDDRLVEIKDTWTLIKMLPSIQERFKHLKDILGVSVTKSLKFLSLVLRKTQCLVDVTAEDFHMPESRMMLMDLALDPHVFSILNPSSWRSLHLTDFDPERIPYSAITSPWSASSLSATLSSPEEGLLDSQHLNSESITAWKKLHFRVALVARAAALAGHFEQFARGSGSFFFVGSAAKEHVKDVLRFIEVTSIECKSCIDSLSKIVKKAYQETSDKSVWNTSMRAIETMEEEPSGVFETISYRIGDLLAEIEKVNPVAWKQQMDVNCAQYLTVLESCGVHTGLPGLPDLWSDRFRETCTQVSDRLNSASSSASLGVAEPKKSLAPISYDCSTPGQILTLRVPPVSADAVQNASVLADAMSEAAQLKFLTGVKAMTTELDQMLVDLAQEFQDQAKLCECFQGLAEQYRPIRNAGIATAVSLKQFADASLDSRFEMLRMALDEVNLADTQAVILEMVEGYERVFHSLTSVKTEHNRICTAAHKLSNQAALVAHEHQDKKQNAKSRGDTATLLGGAGGVGALGGAVLAAASPVGWVLLGGGVITLTASGATKKYQDQLVVMNEKLQLSATTINTQMIRVTSELEKQCGALEKLVSRLDAASKSTKTIQGLIDAWSKEGSARTKMQSKRFKCWLEVSLPKEMSELSKYCEEYLGDAPKEQMRSNEGVLVGAASVPA